MSSLPANRNEPISGSAESRPTNSADQTESGPAITNPPNPDSDDPRGVAYFAALVEGWINSNMERDKQVLTFSSLGLGGLLVFTEKLTSPVEFWLWFAAGALFLGSIIGAMITFKRNGHLIENLINGRSVEAEDAILKVLDAIILYTFCIAAFLTFSLAVVKADFSVTKDAVSIEEVKNAQ